jgi:hypothetical protein
LCHLPDFPSRPKAYRRAYIRNQGGFTVLYLLLILVVVAVAYVALRAVRARANRPTTRVIGPDDDPDFLWRLSRGDNNPR